MIDPKGRYGLLDNPLKFYDVATGASYLGTRAPNYLPPAADDHFLVIRAGERPDQLAGRVPGWRETFGDAAAGMYDVILDQPDNELLNPFALPAGRTVRCPSADRVAALRAK